MKVFSLNIRTCEVALLIFLAAPFLTLRAQEIKSSDAIAIGARPARCKKSNPFLPEVISLSGRAERKHLLERTGRTEQLGIARIVDNDSSRWFLTKQPSAPGNQATATQATTSNNYVFPTKRERFDRFVWNTVGPLSLIAIGASAGWDQSQDNPPEWGQGASGYGKRYASRLGQYSIEQTVSYGLSEAFGLDTGFEKSKRKGFFPRLSDALVQNVTSRTKSGKRIISIPRLVSPYAGGIIAAEAWYPSRFSYKDGLRFGTYSLAAGFGLNVVREFIFHR